TQRPSTPVLGARGCSPRAPRLGAWPPSLPPGTGARSPRPRCRVGCRAVDDPTVLLDWAVVAAAAARVTMLIASDAVLDGPRGRFTAAVDGRADWAAYLVACPRCVGW